MELTEEFRMVFDITGSLLHDNFRAEIHKYYEECDWSKSGQKDCKKFNLKGLHRLDINDY